MFNYEIEYAKLVSTILDLGEVRETRNARTKSVFGTTLHINMSNIRNLSEGYFPLLQGRKMHYKGILGELAAMLRGPKHVQDFKDFGCNYWGQWADDDGVLRLDYGNAWIDFNGFNQLEDVREKLMTNPTDRRMVISGWNPANLDNISLPCCHLFYQWYVRDNMYLDMIWYQRSADTMVGIPSDVVLAAAWNIALANDVGYRPGNITMLFGDTHIYEPHWDMAKSYLHEFYSKEEKPLPSYEWLGVPNEHVQRFNPHYLSIDYEPGPIMNFEVLA